MEKKQRAALRLGAWFAPRTKLGLFARNQMTRLASCPLLWPLIVGPLLRDEPQLPSYHWPVIVKSP
jgi:hypothetical protein